MKLLPVIFTSGWIRVGADALGAWPQVYIHPRNDLVRLVIRHNTPSNYKWALKRATLYAWVLAACWAGAGYDAVNWMNERKLPLEPIPTLTCVALALCTLPLPRILTNWKMKWRPATGRSKSVFTIKRGKLVAPRRRFALRKESTALEQFHSATAHVHPRSQNEELAEEWVNRNRQIKNEKLAPCPRLYRDSSCLSVLAGHRGARLLYALEIYHDPQQKWAGLAAAAVDYVITVAPKLIEHLQPPATNFEVVGHRVAAREI